ncbi:MAG: hypothetical protein Q4F97_05210 [Bacteroidales bacterium]|nr:hypothetical protein [Bacteroidales bacterium]
MMGFVLFVCFAAVVVLLFIIFKKYKPVDVIDKTAWTPSEREAVDVLKKRLETGDITKKEYDEKLQEIVNLHS